MVCNTDIFFKNGQIAQGCFTDFSSPGVVMVRNENVSECKSDGKCECPPTERARTTSTDLDH